MVKSRKQNYKKSIYNKTSQKKILKGGVYTINGIELKPNTVFPDEFDFRGHHLSGINLSGSTLIKANFKGVDLNHANLISAKFVLAKLINPNLNNAILLSCNIIDVDFTS